MSYLSAVPSLVWLLFSAGFFALGEYLSKKWAYQPSFTGVLIVVAAYAGATLTWLPALFKKNELAVMGTLWLLLGTVATVMVGVTVFDEVLSARQMVGLGLALVSFICLSL